MEKYRVVPIRSYNSYTLLWNTFPEEVIDVLLPHYYYNCRCILENGSIDIKTFINVEPIKKFRKNETVVKFSDNIEIGLDN